MSGQTAARYEAARAEAITPRAGEPAWMDWEKVRRGMAFGAQHRGVIGMTWGTTSFYETLGARDAAPIFVATRSLETDRARVARTARAFGELTGPQEGVEEFRSKNLLRARELGRMHEALARTEAIRELGWNPAERRLFNQQAYAGIVHAFALRPVVALLAQKRVSLEADREAIEGWLHLWSVLSYAMGLAEDLMPADYATAVRRDEELRKRQLVPSPGLSRDGMFRMLLQVSADGMRRRGAPGDARVMAVEGMLRSLALAPGLAESLGLAGADARERLLALEF